MKKGLIFAADVGGTNTNIGLCSVKGDRVIIHKKYRFDSQRLKNFEEVVKQVLKDSKTRVSSACIAAAGPVSPDRKTCKLTNVKWRIDVRKLPFKAGLLNDFEALGYAVNVLQPGDAKILRNGKSNNLPIALLGAGTGLGKALLHFDGKFYRPFASEGGHADLPITADESDLLLWCKDRVEYESVLSGRGIVHIYNFMLTKYDGSGTSDPAEIMKENSPAAENTRRQFIKFYARCAKNFVLDGLARGGVIIAGGISAKNPHLFNTDFVKEFMRNETQKAWLSKVPIKLITNYDVGLLGAALFASL
jgi:glucokinase